MAESDIEYRMLSCGGIPMRNLGAACCLLLLAGWLGSAETIKFENLSGYQEDFNLPGIDIHGFEVLDWHEIDGALRVPAHSGNHVAMAVDGDVYLTFTQPIHTFSGYFNYLNVSDSFTTHGLIIGSDNVEALSKYGTNVSHDSNPPLETFAPNELITISSPVPFSTVYFGTGSYDSFAFTMDDISFDAPTAPEPQSWGLILLATCGLIGRAVRRRLTLGHVPRE